MKLPFFLLFLLLHGIAHAQQEKEKENFDRLMPAMGALERGDYMQAIDSLKPLAADGTIEAQYTLATVLETAPRPLRDLEAAYGWYQLAADQGHAVAQTNLALMYGMGLGVPQDNTKMAACCSRQPRRERCARKPSSGASTSTARAWRRARRRR